MYTKKCRVLHIYRGAPVNYSPTRVTYAPVMCVHICLLYRFSLK